MPRKNAKRKSSDVTSTEPSTKVAKAPIEPSQPVTEAKLPTSNRKERLKFEFFDIPCLELAKKLLGQTLVRKLDDGTVVSGDIVETEAYLGAEDPSAHSYTGRTARNAAMFMAPGTAYVYNIYGSLCCMNISSQGAGHAVLLRALDPRQGLDRMTTHRQASRKTSSAKPKPTKPTKPTDLCSGPSKFCQALNIRKESCNELDMVTSDAIWLEKGEGVEEKDVVVSTRIGIEGAGAEAAAKPYRFYVRGNKHVSRRDKKAEGLEK